VAAYAAGAKRLPNLALRSTALLVLLYGMLSLILIAVVELGGLTPGGALIIGVIIAFLQFLLGPFLMDWSLRWFYQCRFVEPDELPEHLRAFIAKVAGQRKIKHPRMGIIEDGAPNAFTYGHHPSNARIVITRGLFELLDERELEAVVAHEIGHAVQWDMLVMTMANLVPLIAYYIYRTLIRIRSRGNDRAAAARYAVAIGAFIVYIISEYIVLWLSRTREYKADHFAGRVTGEPNLLARALVKIGYGLAGRKDAKAIAKEEKKSGARGRTPNLEAIGALGIFDAGAARAMAVSSSGSQLAGGIDGDRLKGAMRWDLWNPWAHWYELNSTHPLIANRLEYLGRQAAQIGQAPLVIFDEAKPESYWDEFFFDLLVLLTPWLLAGGLAAAGLVREDGRLLALAISGYGLGALLRALWSYRGSGYPDMSVAALLKKVKVSAIRGVPCTVRGKVIGRGVPGLVWSEDFVIQDETGILFMDYRQPLRIWEFLFGLMRRQNMQNEEVVATGWYRRAPVPYLELNSLRAQGRTRRCWVYPMKIVGSILLIGLGLFLAMKAGMH
jgi:Zn-dependent protease with chaperone function